VNFTRKASIITPVAGSWELIDGDRTMPIQGTAECLESALLGLPRWASVPNAIAILVAPSGETFSIGIAGRGDEDNPGLEQPLACVEYNRASQDPPYLVPVGDPALTFENGGVVVFRFGGQWTEVLRRNCVAIDVMTRIVNDFVTTGELPTWIAWEEV
jgi:hypothetical protein